MGIEEVLTAPNSPWQNPYSERLNGSIRREYLDHVIVFRENLQRRILGEYVKYYNQSRTHFSLVMDSPESRPVQPPNKVTLLLRPKLAAFIIDESAA